MTDPGFVVYRFRTAGDPGDGRFEYRVWPRLPHPAVSILHSSWPLIGAERRTDIYLATAFSDLDLVKLRDGRQMEVKRRGEDAGPLQFWTMPMSRPFPLPSPALASLADPLGLPAQLPPEAAQSPAHLLVEIDAMEAAVVPRTVRKSRLLFRQGGCRAEICRVSLSGWTGLTVALEAEDRDSMRAAVEALALDLLPNRSYGEVLIRLFDPQPERRGLPARIDSHQGGRQ